MEKGVLKSRHKNRLTVEKGEVTHIKNNTKKQELLAAAYELFVTKGYENTSVDEIIGQVNIAKGTYYYYFDSKEQMLEEVIELMIAREVAAAAEILKSPLNVESKIAGVISAMRPDPREMKVQEVINRPENIIMHQKANEKVIEAATPMLAEIVRQGIEEGTFDCTDVEERVKILLILSNELLDEKASQKTVDVFIKLTEKTLGAAKGTFDFIRKMT